MSERQKIIVGNKLKQILIEEKITQSKFAELSGLSASVIQKICQNKRDQVSLPIGMRIAATLFRPVEDIFYLK